MSATILQRTISALVSRSLTNVATIKVVSTLPSNKSISVTQLHTSTLRLGLEEFFDNPDNYGSNKVPSGRAWRMEELRLKSNTDLHKLWFVLYKERNMLYTMQEAAKQECELFPSPERIDKIETSMINLENVVRERNKAYWQLEVSPCSTGERPMLFRKDVFGRYMWKHCSQHLSSYRHNWHFRNTAGAPTDSDWFFAKYREMKRKHYNYERAKTARYIRDLFRRFPDADADYIAELYPYFPTGYVQHLKNNLHLYDDPPRRMCRSRLLKYEPSTITENVDTSYQINQ